MIGNRAAGHPSSHSEENNGVSNLHPAIQPLTEIRCRYSCQKMVYLIWLVIQLTDCKDRQLDS